LDIIDINELKDYSEKIMGKPNPIEKTERVIGFSEYRDGRVLDYIYEVKR